MAFQDGASDQVASVMMFDGDAWVPVGDPGISAGIASFTTLDFDSGDTPYLAYKDEANSGSLTVQTYTTAGWQLVGSEGFSPGAVNFPVIQLNGLDVPYVAFSYDAEASVMRYNGTTWEIVGVQSFSESISVSMPWYTSLTFGPSDIPYVAYAAQRVYVLGYDGEWQPVGTLPLIDEYSDYTAMDIAADGTIYVAFTNAAGSANVMSYTVAAQPTPSPVPTEAAPTPTPSPIPTEAAPTPTPSPTETTSASVSSETTQTTVSPTLAPTQAEDDAQNPKTGTDGYGGWILFVFLPGAFLIMIIGYKRHQKS